MIFVIVISVFALSGPALIEISLLKRYFFRFLNNKLLYKFQLLQQSKRHEKRIINQAAVDMGFQDVMHGIGYNKTRIDSLVPKVRFVSKFLVVW